MIQMYLSGDVKINYTKLLPYVENTDMREKHANFQT